MSERCSFQRIGPGDRVVRTIAALGDDPPRAIGDDRSDGEAPSEEGEVRELERPARSRCELAPRIVERPICDSLIHVSDPASCQGWRAIMQKR